MDLRKRHFQVAEGDTDSYHVWLTRRPTEPVTIRLNPYSGDPDLTITSDTLPHLRRRQLVRALRRHHPGRPGRRQRRRILVHQAGGGDRGPLLQGPLARLRLGQRNGRRPRRRAHRHRVPRPTAGSPTASPPPWRTHPTGTRVARFSSSWSSPIPSPAAT